MTAMTISSVSRVTPPRRFVAALAVLVLLTMTAPAFADAARGTAAYKAKSGVVTVTFTHAYLMKGPDMVSGGVIRRLVLSTKDIGAALKACQSMMCSDGGIGEGITIDFDAGPRLNYWFVANDQLIQYSGTAKPDAAKLTTDSPTRIAGTISLDAQAAGGPKVDVQFDAALVKELKK
jgi:hypothetical protein